VYSFEKLKEYDIRYLNLMFQMSSSHSFSNVQPCKYFGRHLFFFPPQPQTSQEIGRSQWHDCGYRWEIVTSDSLAVKRHIYLCLLQIVNWKFHEMEGV